MDRYIERKRRASAGLSNTGNSSFMIICTSNPALCQETGFSPAVRTKHVYRTDIMNMNNHSGQETGTSVEKKACPVLPRLCIVSSGTESGNRPDSLLLRQIRMLSPSLPCMVQIREKQLEAAAVLRLCLAAKPLAAGNGTLLLLNERADIAAAACLDGVHLQESSCPPEKLGTLADRMLIGRSVHSPESAREAEKSGVNYLFFGPVFDTPSKRRYGAPQGLAKLGAVCRSVSVPVMAIGGVTPENASGCLSEGAWGLAALSLFTDTRKLPELLKTFEQILAT